MESVKDLFSYRPYWARRFGIAHQLPMTRAEMDALGWDCCDVIIVTGDAYVDHPSFGMAVIGRVLEAHGFRVGIISQPDWTSPTDFARLGRPNLFFGVTGGNMDSMVNRYTADRKVRSNDAYTAGGDGGRRPDRSVIVYSQRCREAFKDAPIVIGGIEASLRRIAHYDYWSDRVRRSVLLDAKADLLAYGNAERAVVEIAHRLARDLDVNGCKDIRGIVCHGPAGATCVAQAELEEIDSTSIDTPGALQPPTDPYRFDATPAASRGVRASPLQGAPIPVSPESVGPNSAGPNSEGPETVLPEPPRVRARRGAAVVRLPSFEAVKDDPVLYAHASRVMHKETNPGNARALVQAHGGREIWGRIRRQYH